MRLRVEFSPLFRCCVTILLLNFDGLTVRGVATVDYKIGNFACLKKRLTIVSISQKDLGHLLIIT